MVPDNEGQSVSEGVKGECGDVCIMCVCVSEEQLNSARALFAKETLLPLQALPRSQCWHRDL